MISKEIPPMASECNKTKKEIFQIAEEKAMGLGYQPGMNLEPIVASLGGKIHYVALEEWYRTQDASIVIQSKDNFDIYISNFSGPLRNRFSIAHELGHYYLHSDEGDKPLRAARSGSNRCEWEANWFAAAFLMPEKEFKAICVKYENDLDYVAAHFLVSRKATNVRSESISRS